MLKRLTVTCLINFPADDFSFLEDFEVKAKHEIKEEIEHSDTVRR